MTREDFKRLEDRKQEKLKKLAVHLLNYGVSDYLVGGEITVVEQITGIILITYDSTSGSKVSIKLSTVDLVLLGTKM